MKEPTAVFDPSDLPIPTRDLRTLVVRPIYASERERWDSLMREHHSLGFGWFAGKSIKHVAFLDGEWVALLGWEPPRSRSPPAILEIRRLG